ncbi:Kazal-type serine protease inhibitor domain [Phytophthora infestans]|uniref:Kazal-type serine protease inhibitor domain n=1 Tax=Phytophthora infestans TaxID=4787 RepID=A0A833WI43_PHYIN|nr:Kazal-type serine protease inhibitor domain [Phytophthora infestans]
MKFATSLALAAIAVTTAHAGSPSMMKDLPTETPSESEGLGGSCNFVCIQVMSPVTDENGVTYSNECMMHAAKCKDNGKREDPLEEYKRIYGKPFGAPRDDDEDESASSNTVTQGEDSDEDESASEEEGSAEGTPKSYCPNIMCLDVYEPVTDENGVTYPNKCSMEAAKCKGPRENVLDEYKRIYGKEFGAPRDDDSRDDEDASASEDSSSPSPATKMVKGTKDSARNVRVPALTFELPVCGSDGVRYSNPCELKIAACKNPEQNIVEEDGACSSKKTGKIDILPVV